MFYGIFIDAINEEKAEKKEDVIFFYSTLFNKYTKQ